MKVTYLDEFGHKKDVHAQLATFYNTLAYILLIDGGSMEITYDNLISIDRIDDIDDLVD